MCGFAAICFLPCHNRVGENESNVNAVEAQSCTANFNKSPCSEEVRRNELISQLQHSADAIKHRGPDGSDVWVNAGASIGLAHSRLSIIDLSPSGTQPLHSDDGLIHAVVNGEIYDHDRLRQMCIEEHGYTFTSESDSELVVAFYRIFGAPGLFEHLRGEFAFVLVDERPDVNKIIAGRDRYGVKPLFWTRLDENILLASEAKAFLPLGWKPEWDVRSLMDKGYMIDDRTIFKGVRKLMPGHWMEITENCGVKINKYWDAEYPVKSSVDPRSFDEMVLGVRERLVEAIRLRLRADVPIGIYLSGGIDSSAIAGIAANLAREEKVRVGSGGSSNISCFTIQFPHESAHNESAIASRTADWLGLDLIKQHVGEEELAESFADAAYHTENHILNLNAVSKFALSAKTREHGFKVVITGEGSDELFAGYSDFLCEYLREADASMPKALLAKNEALRESLLNVANKEVTAAWNWGEKSQGDQQAPEVPTGVNESGIPRTILVMTPSDSIFSKELKERYQDEFDARKTVTASLSPDIQTKMRERWHPLHSAFYMWSKSVLPNFVLGWEGERLEMANSIEGRTPFLDHGLAEYANSLPPSSKVKFTPPDESDPFSWKSSGSAVRALTEKWVLREAVRPYVSEEIYKRKKVPFLTPTKWSRGGPLHSMFEKLLTREAVENLGFVDYDEVRHALDVGFGDQADSDALRTRPVGGMISFAANWDYWPRRLLHIPSMTSVERDENNVYSYPPRIAPVEEPKYNILTYTWGRFRIEDSQNAPALPVQNTPWKIPSIKKEHFSAEQFQRIINFLALDGTDWAWVDVACIHQEDEASNAYEVGQQVSIFKNARRVFIWLSQTKYQDLDLIIARFQDHAMQIRAHIDSLPADLSIEELVDSLQSDISSIFRDAWFSSLWTLQEGVLRNDALFLARDAEPIKWTSEPSDRYMFLHMLINHCFNLQGDLEEIGKPIEESAAVGKVLSNNELKITANITKINHQIFQAGCSTVFHHNANVQYGISKYRKTTRDVDRIYAIMQIYNIRVGKSVDPARNPILSELVEEFGIAINNSCPILGQLFIHTEWPEKGKSWRITESSMVPRCLNIYRNPKAIVRTNILSGTLMAKGKCCSFVDLHSLAHRHYIRELMRRRSDSYHPLVESWMWARAEELGENFGDFEMNVTVAELEMAAASLGIDADDIYIPDCDVSDSDASDHSATTGIFQFELAMDVDVLAAAVSEPTNADREERSYVLGAEVLRQYSGFDIRLLLLGFVDSNPGAYELDGRSYIGLVLCSLDETDSLNWCDGQYRRLGVCVWKVGERGDEEDGLGDNPVWSNCELEIH